MKRIGFTSGSFDPVTHGHLDVIARAARMVDNLVIGIGVHPGKTPLFSPQEKIAMLEARRWVPESDESVAEARTLLGKVDRLYVEDATKIVALVELFWRHI